MFLHVQVRYLSGHTPNKLEAFVEGIVGKQPAKCGAVVVNDSAYIKPFMFKSYRHV